MTLRATLVVQIAAAPLARQDEQFMQGVVLALVLSHMVFPDVLFAFVARTPV